MIKIKYFNSFIKGWNNFGEYTFREIIKINVISSFLYAVIISFSIKLTIYILRVNRNENIKLYALIIFFNGLLLVLYALALPFFLKVSKNLFSNIMKFIGLIICCFLTSITIEKMYYVEIGKYYYLLCLSGIILSIYAKYTYIKLKNIMLEK
ncbi:Uncharacterised protein [uncultured Clostridium sp.]|uniref:hypothetical protein n=1 Tax=uncultured Clostridium sp. TaxID=59620 RepID=UPI0008229A29|nr:hypothetical protein [uncultured Clostridium sp.]SCJ46065.1 Uncharacterised protein [uncultured Clostridium sp.]